MPCTICSESNEAVLVTCKSSRPGSVDVILCEDCVNVQRTAAPCIFSDPFKQATQRLLVAHQQKQAVAKPFMSLFALLADAIKNDQPDAVVVANAAPLTMMLEMLCAAVLPFDFEQSRAADRVRLDAIQDYVSRELETISALADNPHYMQMKAHLSELKLCILAKLWSQ